MTWISIESNIHTKIGINIESRIDIKIGINIDTILTVGFTLHYELALPLRLEPKFVLTSIMIQTMEILIKVFRWTERKNEHAQKILSSKTTGSIFIRANFFLNSKQNKRTGNAHPSTHYVQKVYKDSWYSVQWFKMSCTNKQTRRTDWRWVGQNH